MPAADGGAMINEGLTFQFLQGCIDNLTSAVTAMGFNLSVEDDFTDLKSHLHGQSAVINPTFDPDEHDLQDAFWLRVSDPFGKTIACHAERIYRTDDFVTDYIESGRLWWNRSQARPAPEWRGAVEPPPIRISGSVAYAGSMLIAKEHRGVGLSLILPYLSRALCLRNFHTDFHTGIVRQSLAGSVVPTSNYGYPRTTPVFRGLLPGVKGEFESVHLCWLTRDEGVNGFNLLPTHPKFPIPIPSIARH